MNCRLALLFLAFSSPIFAVNDFWIGCRYSVTVSFNGADLGKKNAPKPKAFPMPVFPAGQMTGELKEEVIVDFTVRVDGAVSEIQLIRAPSDDFRDSALFAIRSWTFQPAIDLRTGNPTSARMRCIVSFTAVEKEAPSEPTAPSGRGSP